MARHSFVVLFNHTVAPPIVKATTVENFRQTYPGVDPESGWGSTTYLVPIGNTISFMQVKGTIVYPVIIVPHGAQMSMKILDLLVVLASQAFSWKAATLPTMPVRPSESESEREDVMGFCVPLV